MGSLISALIGYLYTLRIDVALGIGGFDFLAKIGFYFIHERLWNAISWGRSSKKAAVVWFTGLSGSGKTTLATALASRLQGRGFSVEHLDGDEVRKIIPHLGFNREDRMAFLKQMAFLAARLEKNNVIVVASFVSPYVESRRFARSLCKNFFEIYLSTPLEICERRDVKGLYKKARAGEIPNFSGVGDVFETPESPDLILDTSQIDKEKCLNQILEKLDRVIRD